ncbi:MAG: ribose-phosphate diphosphokinase [Nanoarchaeota archaeon]|nr:ribose-phosphate diphosphokinase [Nanoarchaeota archaeon]
MIRMIIMGLSNSKNLAKDIARKLNVDYSDVVFKTSLDGEMHLKFEKDIKGKRVFLVQSFYPNQNNALLELLFAANLSKDLNAKETILIAPYLPYLREDSRKEKFECISSNIFCNILNNNVDGIISVDPHLIDLKKYFDIPIHSLSTIDLLKDYINKNYQKGVVIVGPDENSRNLVGELGKRFVIMKKKRKGELNVKFEDGYDLSGRKVLLVDDMIITGTTMKKCIEHLGLEKNADCITVHAVMTKDALKELKECANNVISCNTITNETNKIDISGLIARKIKDEWES